jgi:predicted CopG family antitoxin
MRAPAAIHSNKYKILNICLNICLTMSFKTLTIKKSVYEKLMGMKKQNESFSDLFERLSNRNIDTLKKLRGTIEFKNKEALLKDLYKKRKERRYG